MTIPKIYICLVPKTWWTIEDNSPDQMELPRAIADALKSEQRIQKGVNLLANRENYNRLCRFVEDFVIRNLEECILDEAQKVKDKGKFPAIALLDANFYLALIEELAEEGHSIRLGSTLFSPGYIGGHISGFERICKDYNKIESSAVKDRINAFRKAQELNCGVVEISSMWHLGECTLKMQPQKSYSQVEDLHVVGLEELSLSDEQRKEMALIFRAALNRAEMKKGVAWNFSNTAHEVIIEVLNEFVYLNKEPPTNEKQIGVIYADGSQGRPFPLRCLARQNLELLDKVEEDCIKLRATLISMRHLSLDREVDLTWFRNIEASRIQKMAESDNICYELSILRIQEAFREVKTTDKAGLLLRLYHTGLQPAVVGFYRALTEKAIPEWRKAEKFLGIIPMYFRGDGHFEVGRMWT